jgi:hypothetical protein
MKPSMLKHNFEEKWELMGTKFKGGMNSTEDTMLRMLFLTLMEFCTGI